jgi:CheY-like chemotaxis protein
MSGKRILIADDEEVIRMIIRMALDERYDFSEAGDGEEAWAKIENAAPPFDLVIMDLHMPLLDGNELLDRLLAKQPDARAILLTGRLDFDLPTKHPGVRLFRKPFDNAELAKTVAVLLS